MDVKFQRTYAVGDMLYGVTLTMGEVIHGVDAPLVPGAMMMCKLDAVEEGVTEHHIGMGHVYLGTENLLSFCVLSGFHLTEKLEVFLYAAVSPGAWGTGFVYGAAVFPDLFLGLVVNVCKAPLDEFLRPFIELVKIIRRVEFLFPLETKPLDILLDGIHVLSVFLGGICIVIAEVGFSAILLGKAEVQADALGMAKVKVTVGFRREAGDDGIYFTLSKVLLNYFFNEVKFTLFHNIILTPKVTKKSAHISR